jgi:hypothetical protein
MRERMSNYLQGGYTCKIAKLRWNGTGQFVIIKVPKFKLNEEEKNEECVDS